MRWGVGNLADTEDVASQTFEVLWENRLLVRWVSNRSAQLRSPLCGVVRKILANRGRTRENRQRLDREMAQEVEQFRDVQDDEADAFYAAWVEGLLHRENDGRNRSRPALAIAPFDEKKAKEHQQAKNGSE